MELLCVNKPKFEWDKYFKKLIEKYLDDSDINIFNRANIVDYLYGFRVEVVNKFESLFDIQKNILIFIKNIKLQLNC